MTHYQQALDLITDALRGLREQRSDARASRESLERLIAAHAAAGRDARTPDRESESARRVSLPPTPAPEPLPVAPAPPAPAIAPAKATGDNPAKAALLAELRTPTLACTLCPHLVKSRTQVVFGVGNPDAELMFVGEAPGEDEDLQGEPFVGKAGQLLTKIIEAMGLRREGVYIANVLKCRPDMAPGLSGNRKPKPEEMATCKPYLLRQIEIIRPRAMVALGATAMEGLLGETAPMSRLRGRWHDFRGTPLMATYHPAYLLRNQSLSEKRKVWEDMLMVMELLSLSISEKQRGFFLRS